jgi:hypothetical protein
MKLPKLPDAATIQATIDAGLTKLPAAARARIAWVHYVPQGAEWPAETSQTLVVQR